MRSFVLLWSHGRTVGARERAVRMKLISRTDEEGRKESSSICSTASGFWAAGGDSIDFLLPKKAPEIAPMKRHLCELCSSGCERAPHHQLGLRTEQRSGIVLTILLLSLPEHSDNEGEGSQRIARKKAHIITRPHHQFVQRPSELLTQKDLAFRDV